jgi:hypothetical protein
VGRGGVGVGGRVGVGVGVGVGWGWGRAGLSVLVDSALRSLGDVSFGAVCVWNSARLL